jgi:hypothetical protein
MSVLANTQVRIMKTEALIAREERALAKHPEARESILRSIDSLSKVKRQLERQFADAVNSIGSDICTYRLFSEEGNIRIASLANALSSFQHLISVTYDAIKHGPKERARIAADVTAETSLEFGYAFAGSTGFVLTVPNERLLADIPSHLDAAIHTIFEVARAVRPDDISQHVKELGHGPIRAVRSWVDYHVQAGLGADIKWQRQRQERESLLIQPSELIVLRKTIDTTSSETSGQFQDVGELRAANLERKTFSMRFEGPTLVKGTFSDAISEAHAVELPHRYRATITKKVRVNYATDSEDAKYFLDRLERIG